MPIVPAFRFTPTLPPFPAHASAAAPPADERTIRPIRTDAAARPYAACLAALDTKEECAAMLSFFKKKKE